MRRILPTAAVLLCAIATPTLAQSMAGMDMKGMSMPGMEMPPPAKSTPKQAPAKAAPKRKHAAREAHGAYAGHGSQTAPAASPAPAGTMPGMGMSHIAHGTHAAPAADAPAQDQGVAAMPGMGMPDMDMSGIVSAGAGDAGAQPMVMAAPSGTDLPAGHAPAPAIPADHYADRAFGTAAMDRARAQMMREDGGQMLHQILLNLAEIRIGQGHEGYRWDGEAYLGGDINRLWIKSEGEGGFHQGTDSAEVQALFGHAIGPYYTLQAGIRQDTRPTSRRTYATLGFEGLAPYAFETEGALFLSNRGDLLGRLEAWYDQRITQRLLLQPRAELNFAAQNVPEDRYGAGLVDAELGLRLRYEIRRDFAPYVGVSWDRKTGRSADYARADGQRPGQTSFVMGIRTWF